MESLRRSAWSRFRHDRNAFHLSGGRLGPLDRRGPLGPGAARAFRPLRGAAARRSRRRSLFPLPGGVAASRRPSGRGSRPSRGIPRGAPRRAVAALSSRPSDLRRRSLGPPAAGARSLHGPGRERPGLQGTARPGPQARIRGHARRGDGGARGSADDDAVLHPRRGRAAHRRGRVEARGRAARRGLGAAPGGGGALGGGHAAGRFAGASR